jgi:heat shock protein HslJ
MKKLLTLLIISAFVAACGINKDERVIEDKAELDSAKVELDSAKASGNAAAIDSAKADVKEKRKELIGTEREVEQEKEGALEKKADVPD